MGVLTGHDDRWWHGREAESVVIARVADQEHQAPAEIGGPRQAFEDQGAPDTDGAALRVRGDGTEEEGRHAVEPDRPISDRPDDPPRFFGDQTEVRERGDALSIPIGRLTVPAGTESTVQEGFDGRTVGRLLEADAQHGGGRSVGGVRDRSPRAPLHRAARWPLGAAVHKPTAARRRSRAKAAAS